MFRLGSPTKNVIFFLVVIATVIQNTFVYLGMAVVIHIPAGFIPCNFSIVGAATRWDDDVPKRDLGRCRKTV